MGITSGDLTIMSTGDIATTGRASSGIYAYNYIGTITVASTGDITTQGGGASGIEALAGTGATSITSSGNITTTDVAAIGIAAHSFFADVTICLHRRHIDRCERDLRQCRRRHRRRGHRVHGKYRPPRAPTPPAFSPRSTAAATSPSPRRATSPRRAGRPTASCVVSDERLGVEIVNSGNISATGTGSAGIYAGGHAGNVSSTSAPSTAALAPASS